MSNGNEGSHTKRWMFWIGLCLIAGAGIAVVVLWHFMPWIFDSGWLQFALVVSFVAGLVFVVFDLHSVGRIRKEALERLTFALAIAAIIFALWQFRDSRRQEARMEILAKEMSTHFVGVFPKNLKAIDEAVAHADRSLDIMADFLGYGHYSAPEEFRTYLRALEDLRSKQVPLRILVYSRKKGGEVHDRQFPEDNVNAILRRSDSHLVTFCQHFNGGKLPKSKQEFDSLLFRKQKDYLDDLKDRGAHIRMTDEELPFYLWNEDDQEAVVVFLNEVSFETRDNSLVLDTFKVRFCQLWNKADDFDPNSSDWRAKVSGHDLGTNCAVRGQ